MSYYNLENDIHLFCVKAESFPEGIHGAQQKLSSLPAASGKRNYFGLSYMYDDGILYMAAAELSKNETIPAGCESYTFNKGQYISIYVADFRNDPGQIEQAFKTLLADPRIDENGCCAECYLPEGSDFNNARDVRCMVKLADEHVSSANK